MTGCYLTSLPREFMRGVADFDPDYKGAYFLPRACVSPPPCLLDRVWPEADGWHAAHMGLPTAPEKVEPNLASGAFLELLLKLKIVFLQASEVFSIYILSQG